LLETSASRSRLKSRFRSSSAKRKRGAKLDDVIAAASQRRAALSIIYDDFSLFSRRSRKIHAKLIRKLIRTNDVPFRFLSLSLSLSLLFVDGVFSLLRGTRAARRATPSPLEIPGALETRKLNHPRPLARRIHFDLTGDAANRRVKI